MLHIRATCPAQLTDAVVAQLQTMPAVAHIVLGRGTSILPAGDVVECDVAREGASDVIAWLQHSGLEHEGAIVATPIDVCVSKNARQAEERAPGLGTDAVVWQEIEERTGEETYLSATFVAFMVVAMLIAAIGIMIDSPILIVGAMVVGPDFGPVAAMCVGLVRGHLTMVRRAAVAMVVATALGIVVTYAMTLSLTGLGQFQLQQLLAKRPMTSFISKPDVLSWVVAFFAGVAGMLSLTSAKSGALIGVLISVTTIPAAACIAVGLAFGQWSIAGGSAIQLGINCAALLSAGILTLLTQQSYLAWLAHRSKNRPVA